MCNFVNNIYIFSKTLQELETNLYSCLRNAVRGGHNISRLAEYYQSRLKQELGMDMKLVGHVFVLDTGGQSTISGSGEMYEEFKRSGALVNYAGYGEVPKTFYDKGYKTASVRSMNLDETYHRMPYDSRRSKICNIQK